jgi:Lipopolysaccharide-assembly
MRGNGVSRLRGSVVAALLRFRVAGQPRNLVTSQPLFALVTLLALTHCGYALVGHSNFLDPKIRTVQVPAFVNRTTRVELEQRVTQAVADEMVARGRLKLVTAPPDADVILRGSIDSFGLFAIAYNAQGRATQYQVSVTAKIELLDHRNDDKVLWKNDQYRFTENYQVNTDSTDAFDQETRAIREIAVRFAETLVTNLLEGF